MPSMTAVSYTHLDVYKRQHITRLRNCLKQNTMLFYKAHPAQVRLLQQRGLLTLLWDRKTPAVQQWYSFIKATLTKISFKDTDRQKTALNLKTGHSKMCIRDRLYTEADYENSVIELFRNDLGYEYAYGPDIERDVYSPLYEEILIDSLYRLNRDCLLYTSCLKI